MCLCQVAFHTLKPRHFYSTGENQSTSYYLSETGGGEEGVQIMELLMERTSFSTAMSFSGDEDTNFL